MGTPVPIREREEQCRGAGPCSDPRPMTEEEMLKYYTKEEIERMGTKIAPPEKEKLIETLAEVEGKTKAIYHAAKVFLVSSPVIYSWLKQYGIEFDNDGRVIRTEKEYAEFEVDLKKLSEIEIPKPVIDDTGVIHFEDDIDFEDSEIGVKAKCEVEPENTITITGQETKEIPYKLGYAEYDIKDALVQIDFRQELVSISTGKEMTFEEAIAVAERILDVLGNE